MKRSPWQFALSLGILLFVLWHLAHHPDLDGGGAVMLLAVKELIYLVKDKGDA